MDKHIHHNIRLNLLKRRRKPEVKKEELKKNFLFYQSYSGSIDLIKHACLLSDKYTPTDDINCAVCQFRVAVQQAASESIKSYRKDIDININFYCRRFNFTITKPPNRNNYSNSIFGDNSLKKLSSQYNAYKLTWSPTLQYNYASSYDYWNRKSQIWSELSSYAIKSLTLFLWKEVLLKEKSNQQFPKWKTRF